MSGGSYQEGASDSPTISGATSGRDVITNPYFGGSTWVINQGEGSGGGVSKSTGLLIGGLLLGVAFLMKVLKGGP